MKKLFTLLLCLPSFTLFAQQGEISGTVTDENNEGIPNAQVFVTAGGIQQGAVVTDFDGNYSVKPLAAGIYATVVRYEGYKRDSVYDIAVSMGRGAHLNFKLERPTPAPPQKGAYTQANSNVTARTRRYVRPQPVRGWNGTFLLPEEKIEKMSTRSMMEVYPHSRNCHPYPRGTALTIGGGRAEKTLYIIDGVQLFGYRDTSANQRSSRKVQIK